MAVKIAASRVASHFPVESRTFIPVTNSKVQAPVVVTSPGTQAESARVSPPKDCRVNRRPNSYINARTEAPLYDDGVLMEN